DDVREATGLDCRLSVGEKSLPDAVGQELEGTLFRIAQELITNVVRHAKATQAVIMLQHTDQRVMLTVRDNGQGGRLIMTKGKYGLRGIHERTELLGGQVEMRSGRRGTVVTVALPFELPGRNQGSNGAASKTAARTRRR
ncbi:MAG TPA: ATP-binding protein, partial [Nitrospira sp.]|nr:ATP-binding protein [Nitrospira sp.]